MDSPGEIGGKTASGRSHPLYALLIMLVIAAGLASRSSFADHLPEFIGTYAGDTLWALTLFLVLGFTFPEAGPRTIALATLVLAFAVEFSQLYQADWINAVRATRVGALVLGHGFLWTDLLCYTVGCVVGWMAEEDTIVRPGQTLIFVFPAGEIGGP